MYKRMLVLLDGSKLAEVVFSYARELSGRFGLDLDLLHVCNSQEADQLPMREAYVEHMAEELKKQSEDLIQKVGAEGKKKSINVKSEVLVGYPADEILKYIDENEIDLLLLSTHGSSGIRRWGLGSVAEKVIHESSVPVWLVPSQLLDEIIYDKFQERSVLIPLDGSPKAESILPHIQELTIQRRTDTEFLLLYVAKLPPVPMVSQSREWVQDITAIKKAGQEYLDKTVKKLKNAGFQARGELVEGDPAEEIVKYATEHHPRLIAMSTHGRTGFTKFIFSSVTESVLRRLRKTPLFLVGPAED
ncbi:MAG: universal stress protein [Dehalococcoidales bacterium]|nr:universal stress protein [Dehalococcoidales bacterium]